VENWEETANFVVEAERLADLVCGRPQVRDVVALDQIDVGLCVVRVFTRLRSTEQPMCDPANPFVAVDGHYNPTGLTHSHHVGDMPVLYVNADGSVETRFHIDRIAPRDLNDKVVILHAGADNFANIPTGDSLTQYTPNSADATTATAKTGNAGDRVACGVISSR
jgi:hypothetical protein